MVEALSAVSKRQETIWSIKICVYTPWKYKSTIFLSFSYFLSYLNPIINFTTTYPNKTHHCCHFLHFKHCCKQK